MHTEYLVDDGIYGDTVSRTPEQVTATLEEFSEELLPLPVMFGDNSPIRRALRAHIQAYQGLTQPAPASAESVVYKDTASGNIV